MRTARVSGGSKNCGIGSTVATSVDEWIHSSQISSHQKETKEERLCGIWWIRPRKFYKTQTATKLMLVY